MSPLKDLAKDWNLPSEHSHLIPATPVWKFYAKDQGGNVSRVFKPLHISWGAREAKDDHFGVGILPFLEIFGAVAEDKIPSRNAWEKEMVKMLRAFVGQAQFPSLTNLGEAISQEQRPECPAAKVISAWPKFKALTNSAGLTSTAAPGPQSGLQPVPQPGPLSGTAPGKTCNKPRGKAQPIAPTKTSKYSTLHGLFSTDYLNEEIPSDIKEALVDNANASLAYQSWRAIKSVKRRVAECEKETAVDLSIPWNQNKLTIFTGWCLKRGLRNNTIENYISKVNNQTEPLKTHLINFLQVKKLHDIQDVEWTSRQSKMAKKAIAGRANIQEKKASRLAMTPDVMWLLKTKLAKAVIPLVKKRLIWAVACTLFVGSLRSGETLPSNKTVFVKDATLLNKHVTSESKNIEGQSRKFLKLFLEAPKEDRTGRGVEVELFEINNFFCPVTAWNKWRNSSKLAHQPNLPVFRLEDGSGYTAKELNSDLKALLEDEVDYSNGRVSSHSFRAGITSTMARLGYSKEMIGLQGRWRSEAYLNYCKLGRINRLNDQARLMEDMASAATAWISGGILVH